MEIIEPFYLAVDLGGTKILAALVAGGRVIARDYSLTHATLGVETVVGNIVAAVGRILRQGKLAINDIRGVAIAAAGAVDTHRGVVTLSPNLPGWKNIPLAEMLGCSYPVPVSVVNDANAQAIGEHRFGAGRGTRNMVFITVSTGIGGGIIIDNKIYEGAGGAAGEIGHMTLDINGPECSCGNRGCLETLASGTAIAREARERLKRGEPSIMMEMVSGNPDVISAIEVGNAARKQDRLAREIIERAAFFLGVGLVNLVNIFNPEVIVIGGGVSRMGELLLEPVRRVVRERAFPYSAGMVRIVTGELGDDAGILGAAAWIEDKGF